MFKKFKIFLKPAIIKLNHLINLEILFLKSWVIRHGITNLKQTQRGQNFTIEKYYQHEKYDETAYFDVAILQVTPVIFNRHLRPICLPDFSNFKIDRYDDRTSNVIGWGSKETSGITSPTLKRTSLTIYGYR